MLYIFGILDLNEIFIEKYANRYYMMEKELEEIKDVDVQIYGSCHAYTSFHSAYFEETYGISSYNMANPSEIMPATYLRMYERFKVDTPEVAVVEIWGVNAYETYFSSEEILDDYLRVNVELIPFSREKMEVINDFEALDMIEDNIPITKYRDRLLQFKINEFDFDYSFEKANEKYNPDGTDYFYGEMVDRFENNGYRFYSTIVLDDYEEQQAYVEPWETLEVEADLMKYVEKIIQLCEENDVELIFYRAPYRSCENELRKANWLEEYFSERNISYYDLEKEIEWNYGGDFYDYEHLGYNGAIKATDFLGDIIIEKMNK